MGRETVTEPVKNRGEDASEAPPAAADPPAFPDACSVDRGASARTHVRHSSKYR